MKYLGSKARVAKELTQIIQRYIDCNGIDDYYEPFCGGCNVIDKIYCKNKYASDNHRYLISLLKYVQEHYDNLPVHISEAQYNEVKENMDGYEEWYVGLVGFCATFSAKWFETYARDRKTNRDISSESIRNLRKQAPNLRGIQFRYGDYSDLTDVSGALIY